MKIRKITSRRVVHASQTDTQNLATLLFSKGRLKQVQRLISNSRAQLLFYSLSLLFGGGVVVTAVVISFLCYILFHMVEQITTKRETTKPFIAKSKPCASTVRVRFHYIFDCLSLSKCQHLISSQESNLKSCPRPKRCRNK